MSALSDLVERAYVATVYGNTNAATRYLEEARKILRDEDKRKADRSFKLPRFWLAFKAKLPVLLRHW